MLIQLTNLIIEGIYAASYATNSIIQSFPSVLPKFFAVIVNLVNFIEFVDK